jgi:excisionase family DNA binding protein
MADAPATEPTPVSEQITEGERAKWIGLGAACAPPPRMPPGYTPPPVPDYLFTKMRPEAWTCRACCSFWDWVYRPPTEAELDGACAVCSGVLSAEERKVEVDRLLLAQVSTAAKTVVPPVPVSTMAAPPRPDSKAGRPGSMARICTVEDAAAILGCGPTKVYELLSQGLLKPANTFGRKRMFFRSDVEALLNPPTRPPPWKRQAEAAPAKPRVRRDAKSLAAAIAKLPVK